MEWMKKKIDRARADMKNALLNNAVYAAMRSGLGEGKLQQPGIVDFVNRGVAWVSQNFPSAIVGMDGKETPTPIGSAFGFEVVKQSMESLANAGTILRTWLGDSEHSRVQLEPHKHLNERTDRMYTTTVAVALLQQPVVFIWNVPETQKEKLQEFRIPVAKGQTMRLPIHVDGTLRIPDAIRTDVSYDPRYRSPLLHAGIYLHRKRPKGTEGPRPTLRLVTTDSQFKAFLQHFGYPLNTPLSQLGRAFTDHFAEPILPGDVIFR